MLDLKFDKIFVPFGKLSGGEQVKGQLASVLLSDSNFLTQTIDKLIHFKYDILISIAL